MILLSLLSHCEKYRFSTELYLFQWKGKISIQPLKKGRRNKERIQESIMQRESINTPQICCTQHELFCLFYGHMGVII